jgi:hypothetical protein
MVDKTRKERKLEKCRANALSSITGDRMRVELMAQRPRTDDSKDKLDTALLQTVLERLAEIESKAKNATTEDELNDLLEDGELQGLFAAYFCPINDIQDEGILAIDTIEGWGIPKSSPKRLRDLFSEKLKNASSDPCSARGALHSIYAEMDAWGDFIDDYEDTMEPYMNWLFRCSVGMLLGSILALYFASKVPFLVFVALLLAGATGSCVSVMGKMPALDASLSGELDAYGRRVFTRIGVGLIASLIGCGLLGWGVLPVSIENVTFSEALNECVQPSSPFSVIVRGLVVLTVPMLLGFSERALTTFESRFLGELHSSAKRR